MKGGKVSIFSYKHKWYELQLDRKVHLLFLITKMASSRNSPDTKQVLTASGILKARLPPVGPKTVSSVWVWLLLVFNARQMFICLYKLVAAISKLLEPIFYEG